MRVSFFTWVFTQLQSALVRLFSSGAGGVYWYDRLAQENKLGALPHVRRIAFLILRQACAGCFHPLILPTVLTIRATDRRKTAWEFTEENIIICRVSIFLGTLGECCCWIAGSRRLKRQHKALWEMAFNIHLIFESPKCRLQCLVPQRQRSESCGSVWWYRFSLMWVVSLSRSGVYLKLWAPLRCRSTPHNYFGFTFVGGSVEWIRNLHTCHIQSSFNPSWSRLNLKSRFSILQVSFQVMPHLGCDVV